MQNKKCILRLKHSIGFGCSRDVSGVSCLVSVFLVVVFR